MAPCVNRNLELPYIIHFSFDNDNRRVDTRCNSDFSRQFSLRLQHVCLEYSAGTGSTAGGVEKRGLRYTKATDLMNDYSHMHALGLTIGGRSWYYDYKGRLILL